MREREAGREGGDEYETTGISRREERFKTKEKMKNSLRNVHVVAVCLSEGGKEGGRRRRSHTHK